MDVLLNIFVSVVIISLFVCACDYLTQEYNRLVRRKHNAEAREYLKTPEDKKDV